MMKYVLIILFRVYNIPPNNPPICNIKLFKLRLGNLLFNWNVTPKFRVALKHWFTHPFYNKIYRENIQVVK